MPVNSFTCCVICFDRCNCSGFLCEPCLQKIRLVDNCLVLSREIHTVFCSYAYRPPVSFWLRSLKDQRQLNHLQKLIWLMLAEPFPWITEVDAIVYIPSDTLKLAKRGFNPAELFANSVAKSFNKPIYQNAFIKRNSKDQRGLSKKERKKNIRNSLKAGSLKLEGEHILLIEDVVTTGATAIEAARVLKQQGAREVSVWALAHTPFNTD